MRWIPFDFGKAKAHTSIGIRTPESATIAPGGIEAVVRSPGDRPQIAANGGGLVGIPVPMDRADDGAGRVGRRVSGWTDLDGSQVEAHYSGKKYWETGAAFHSARRIQNAE